MNLLDRCFLDYRRIFDDFLILVKIARYQGFVALNEHALVLTCIMSELIVLKLILVLSWGHDAVELSQYLIKDCLGRQ